jgi:hypothetical protein
MKGELPHLLSDANQLSRGLLTALKTDGLDAGREYGRDFAQGFMDSEGFITAAYAATIAKATKSSFREGYGATGGGAGGIGGPSSVTYQYNLPNAQIVANDPGQMGRQLEMQTRRKNLART